MKKKPPARKAKRSRKSPKVGDRVSIRFANGASPALVVEDYGPLGIGGRKILRVRLLEIDSEFDIPVEDVLAPA